MAKGSLAKEVLGITNPANMAGSIKVAHKTLTGIRFKDDDPAYMPPKDAEEMNAWLEGLSRDEWERYHLVQELIDLIVRKEAVATNSLIDWPMYSALMDEYGTKGDGTARALMIGSFNAISSRSFVCLTEDVYGAGEAIIVDLEASESKARHGTFIQADGLNLPLTDGSVDFVHTSQLLHKIINPSAPNIPFIGNVKKLVREIGRVLAPGGQVLMKELIPNYVSFNLESEAGIRHGMKASTDLGRRVGRLLIEQGVKCEVLPALQMTDINFLFDPTRDFFSYEHGINPVGFAVHGTKQG